MAAATTPICVNQPSTGSWMMLAPPLTIISRTPLAGVIAASSGLATNASVVSRYASAITSHMPSESAAATAKSESERIVSSPE